MKSAKHQRIFSVVLGAGLLVTGSFFALPLMVAAYILGLMLIGFGIESRMTDEPAEIMPVAPARSRQIAKKPPRMAAAPKKKTPKARKKPAKRRRKK